MKEPIEAATQRGVGQAALVRRMCEIILGNTFGNEELDSLALLVGHHPDVLNAAPAPAGELLKEAAWLRNECSAENADGNWISMSIDQALDLASLLERQAAPVPVMDDYKVASDKTMRRIRSTTKRWKVTAVITTNDSAIDTRLGAGIWKVLDADNEILESVSLPQLLPSNNALPLPTGEPQP